MNYGLTLSHYRNVPNLSLRKILVTSLLLMFVTYILHITYIYIYISPYIRGEWQRKVQMRSLIFQLIWSHYQDCLLWRRVFICTITIRLADAHSFFLASMMWKPLIIKLYTDRLTDNRSQAGDSDRSATQVAPRGQPAGGASTSKGTSLDSQVEVTSSRTTANMGSKQHTREPKR